MTPEDAGERTLSTNLVEPPKILAAPEGGAAAVASRPLWGIRSVGSVVAPVAATLVALAAHWFFADVQPPPPNWMDRLPAWLHPYPLLLVALLAVAVVGAAIQGTWPAARRRWLDFAPLLAGAVGVLCVWELMTAKWGWMPQPYFPGPDEVLGALIDDRAVLLESAWHSLRLLLSGYLVGVAAGLVTGVLIGWFPAARYWGMPVLKTIGPVPATALVPLAMTLFPASLSFFSGTSLIAFAVWFPMTMLTASGIANVRLSYLDVARTLGAGRLYLIFRVAIPAALPNIFLGLFQGLGASFLTLIVAETVGVKAGLGWYLQWQKGYAEYGKVYASLVIMAVFFSGLMTLLFLARDRLLRWQKGVIKW
jgi:NitT/TauT family transport system permease protein